jgi:hypothetical protein
MENLICRVELHHAATGEQYDAFHAGMGQLGLERLMMRNAVAYSLPTGLYLGSNAAADLASLADRIRSLALQITGYPCALVLAPVNLSDVYIAGLESPSYADELGEGITSWHRMIVGPRVVRSNPFGI